MLEENGVICAPREGMFYGFDGALVIGGSSPGTDSSIR